MKCCPLHICLCSDVANPFLPSCVPSVSRKRCTRGSRGLDGMKVLGVHGPDKRYERTPTGANVGAALTLATLKGKTASYPPYPARMNFVSLQGEWGER